MSKNFLYQNSTLEQKLLKKQTENPYLTTDEGDQLIFSEKGMYDELGDNYSTMNHQNTSLHPIFFTKDIFLINTKNIEERIQVHYIEEYDNNVIIIDDFYLYPLAVRDFSQRVPFTFSNHMSRTAYPGFVSGYKYRMKTSEGENTVSLYGSLLFLLNELIDTYIMPHLQHDSSQTLENLELLPIAEKSWKNFSELIVDFACYSKNLCLVESGLCNIHQDGDGEGKKHFLNNTVAGLIYLNLPKECSGGTAIYQKRGEATQKEPIFEFDMKFNRFVLYPAYMFHAMNNPDGFEGWRMIQRIFMDIQKDNFIKWYYENYIQPKQLNQGGC